MSCIAIIAAMERELQPLVRDWKQETIEHGGRSYRCHRRDNLLALAGGIGCDAAQQASEAVVARYRPEMLVSAGLAGALDRSLKVGNVIVPGVIIDARNGSEYRCSVDEDAADRGVLVSAAQIAGGDAKQKLAEEFHALAVDMEAAGVAEVARRERIGFRCVKAISDEAGFAMPPLNRFVNARGEFENSRLVGWAIVRPMVWPKVAALARNSGLAANALCDWLRQHLGSGLKPATIVMLSKSELSAKAR